MINKVILIGNLGSDPETKNTQSSTVATLSVATSRAWKDKEGQKHDETEWHRVIVWGATAEFCGKYLSKGSKVYIEGRLQTRKWKDNIGVDRYTTEIVAESVQNLSPRSDAQEQPPTPQQNNFTGDDVPF